MIKTEHFTLALWPSREMLHFHLGKSWGGISGYGESEIRERKTIPTKEHMQTAFLSLPCLAYLLPIFHFLIPPLFSTSFPPHWHFLCLLLKDDLIENQKKKKADWIKNARWKPPAQKVLGRVMRMWWNGKIKWEWGVWTSPCQNRNEYVWEMQYISGNP